MQRVGWQPSRRAWQTLTVMSARPGPASQLAAGIRERTAGESRAMLGSPGGRDGDVSMSSSILNVTFDCSDAASVAQFWSAVTGWPWSRQDMPGNPFWVVGESGRTSTRLVFVNVPESKQVKNRVHLDIVADGSQTEELTRLEALGACVIEDRRHLSP